VPQRAVPKAPASGLLGEASRLHPIYGLMRVMPVTKEAVLYVAAGTLAPVVPLALTMLSLEDLLKTLLGPLF
jgi:hypothetical protein